LEYIYTRIPLRYGRNASAHGREYGCQLLIYDTCLGVCVYQDSSKVRMTHMRIRPRNSVNYRLDAHVCLHFPKGTESLRMRISESHELFIFIVCELIIMVYFIC